MSLDDHWRKYHEVTSKRDEDYDMLYMAFHAGCVAVLREIALSPDSISDVYKRLMKELKQKYATK